MVYRGYDIHKDIKGKNDWVVTKDHLIVKRGFSSEEDAMKWIDEEKRP